MNNPYWGNDFFISNQLLKHDVCHLWIWKCLVKMRQASDISHHCGVRGATPGYAGADFSPVCFSLPYSLPVNRFPLQPVLQG